MEDYYSSVFKIRESIDVYKSKNQEGQERIQFYKINTRDKVTIIGSDFISQYLAKLDGKLNTSEIISILGVEVDKDELYSLLRFLLDNRILVKSKNEVGAQSRYDRQVNFFDDWSESKSGSECQEMLSSKSVVVFGVGAIGGTISLMLARAGVEKLIIVDDKVVNKKSAERHYYFRIGDVGRLKVDALKDYICKVNKDVAVETISKKLLPETDLDQIISNHTDLVINTADEPYIGHTTLKIGRHLWPKGIPMYVAGGFDAHLTSTGEFIIPGATPCADCCSNTFKIALKDWKPTYARSAPNKPTQSTDRLTAIQSGPGGFSSMSLFSASYATTQIIRFLLNNSSIENSYTRRGEYLVNKGKMTWVQLEEQEGCDVCSTK